MFFKFKNVHALCEGKDVTFEKSEQKYTLLLLFLAKKLGFIRQNWVDCLEVTYEAICLNETATLTEIKEVIKLYSYLKTTVSEGNVKEVIYMYVGPTDVRTERFQHFH